MTFKGTVYCILKKYYIFLLLLTVFVILKKITVYEPSLYITCTWMQHLDAHI